MRRMRVVHIVVILCTLAVVGWILGSYAFSQSRWQVHGWERVAALLERMERMLPEVKRRASSGSPLPSDLRVLMPIGEPDSDADSGPILFQWVDRDAGAFALSCKIELPASRHWGCSSRGRVSVIATVRSDGTRRIEQEPVKTDS